MTSVGETFFHPARIPAEFALLGAGLVLGAATAALKVAVTHRSLLEKYVPALDGHTLSIAALCALSAALFALGIVRKPAAGSPLAGSDTELVATAGAVNILILAGTLVLLFSKPDLLNSWNDELGLVALLQDSLVAMALLLSPVAFARARRLETGRSIGKWGPWFVSLMATSLFLLLMEETSWGQHFVGWGTPSLFAGNVQNETNLHNFHTNEYELVYYGGAMFAFVLLPLWLAVPRGRPVEDIRIYVPPPAFAIAALPVATYMFIAWNIVPLQIMFFLAVFVGLSIVRWNRLRTSAMAGLVISSMSAAQIAFLVAGNRLPESWELEEMRELTITWLLFVYMVWLCRNLARSSQTRIRIDRVLRTR